MEPVRSRSMNTKLASKQASKQPHPSLSTNNRQSQLAARLPGQNLGNGMPDRDAGLLNLLLGETGCDADFERGL